MRKHRIIIDIDDYGDENLKDFLPDIKQTLINCLDDAYNDAKIMDVKIEDVDEGEV